MNNYSEKKKCGGLRLKGIISKSHDQKPLISIITCVLNGEKYLEETILSIRNQTYKNYEYIIIDGESSDSTLSIINKNEDIIYNICYNFVNKNKFINKIIVGFKLPAEIIKFFKNIKKPPIKIFNKISPVNDVKLVNPNFWEK